jgi:hypothetical protein
MFLARFQWYRKWRGGKWARTTGLFWGRNWIRIHPADEVFERVEEDYTKQACSICVGCLPPGEQCRACGRINKEEW